MPHDAPAAKLAATRGYGANVVIYQRHSEDREEITRRLATERGLTLVPPYDYPQVIAGQGTAARRSCLKRPGHWICCWCAPAAAACWPAVRWRRTTGRRAVACSASSPKPATTFSKPFSAVNRCTSRCRKPLPTARRPTGRAADLPDHSRICRRHSDGQRRPAVSANALLYGADENGG